MAVREKFQTPDKNQKPARRVFGETAGQTAPKWCWVDKKQRHGRCQPEEIRRNLR
jgi:hypothetical protein